MDTHVKQAGVFRLCQTGAVTPEPTPSSTLTTAPDPTLFEWFAEIWIPSLLGLATVAVGVVALIISHRATELAKDVEAQREKAAKQREEDDRRRRILDMATEEARTLHRYVVETLRHRIHLGRPDSGPPRRSPAEQASIDARVALEQSLVVGASDLFAITKFDLENRWQHIPEPLSYGEDGYDEQERFARAKASDRMKRTMARIRNWASNPELTAPEIAEDLRLALEDSETYWARI